MASAAKEGDTKEQIRRKMLSYALVRTRMEGSNDPVAALSPFLVPIANDLAGEDFQPTRLRDELTTRYGLSLSHDVTQVFVDQLLSLKYLRRTGDGYRTVWLQQNTNVEPDDV